MNKIRLLLVSALMLAAFVMAPAPALAEVNCQYGGYGNSDNGPCVEFRNNAGRDYHLYCLQGHTSSSHKIQMNNNDSFTCNITRSNAAVAKTNVNNSWADHYWSCNPEDHDLLNQGAPLSVKNVITLNANQEWEHNCHR